MHARIRADLAGGALPRSHLTVAGEGDYWTIERVNVAKILAE